MTTNLNFDLLRIVVVLEKKKIIAEVTDNACYENYISKILPLLTSCI